jgi:hypothetical protein
MCGRVALWGVLWDLGLHSNGKHMALSWPTHQERPSLGKLAAIPCLEAPHGAGVAEPELTIQGPLGISGGVSELPASEPLLMLCLHVTGPFLNPSYQGTQGSDRETTKYKRYGQ